MSVVYGCPDDIASSGEGILARHRAVGLLGLAGFADGGVEFRSFLGLVLGLEEVADYAGRVADEFRLEFADLQLDGDQAAQTAVEQQQINEKLLAVHLQAVLAAHEGEHAAHGPEETRARMTQIMNLLLLAPDIQEKLLNLPQTTSGRDTVILRELQAIALQPDWTVQQQMWYELYGDISQK